MNGSVLIVETRCHPVQVVLPVLATLLNEGGDGDRLGRCCRRPSAGLASAKSQIHLPDLTWIKPALQMQSGLASGLIRIHSISLRFDQISVKGIFHVGLLQRLVVKPLCVGLVFGEQPGSSLAATQPVGAQPRNITADQQVILQAK